MSAVAYPVKYDERVERGVPVVRANKHIHRPTNPGVDRRQSGKRQEAAPSRPAESNARVSANNSF